MSNVAGSRDGGEQANPWTQAVNESCGCWQGMGHRDVNCHRYGLCSLEAVPAVTVPPPDGGDVR